VVVVAIGALLFDKSLASGIGFAGLISGIGDGSSEAILSGGGGGGA
jgi:hypothetical protein